ncbi:MAG: hypothetical protein ROZ64_08990 [Burkholderiaceae bacterium]|jgi:hypothetical protein|nr:hypothetical protein [Burkholderiaceae bacterium]
MHVPHADWFQRLTGFRELAYDETRARLEVRDGRLFSRVNDASYGIGDFAMRSLAELREEALAQAPSLRGRLSVSNVCGDVRRMHHEHAHDGALFQVASQFNALEMVGPSVSPEDGVTRYEADRTQGPACAIAAGAATIYRNYFAPVDGEQGQTAARQLDGLAGLGAALDNRDGRLWLMRNGYALCTPEGLAEIDRRIAGATAAQVGAWRDLLRIGVHRDVEVTDARDTPRPTVSQAFCSALPVSYTRIDSPHWSAFATLVLEGAYEATLWAAVLNAVRGASPLVFLTWLGGGAFGNDENWIHAAMRRALRKVAGLALDVRLVSYGAVPPELRALAAEFAKAAT